jgi:hypothetical protein
MDDVRWVFSNVEYRAFDLNQVFGVGIFLSFFLSWLLSLESSCPCSLELKLKYPSLLHSP